jgi:hypothetical protein
MDISVLCSKLHWNLYCCYIIDFRNNVKTHKFTLSKGLVVESILFNDDVSTIDDIFYSNYYHSTAIFEIFVSEATFGSARLL